MTQIPALVISGTCDSNEAADLLVRYRIDGTTDWNQASIPVNTGDLTITSVLPSTLYNVEIAYRSIRGVQSDWLALDDVTTDLMQVDTPDITLEAVTERDQQVQVNGFGGAGTIIIAYRGASEDTYTQLDEYAFTYGGVGTVQVLWIGCVQWQANSSKTIFVYLCVDGAPSITLGVESGYEITQTYNGNQNALTSTVVLAANINGLSTGAHTIEIYGKCDSSSNMPFLDVGAITRFEVGKR